MYFIGCSSIYLMCAISFERFYVALSFEKPNLKKLSNKTCVCLTIFCMLIGLFWSSIPILGWSNYTCKKSGCSVNLKGTSWNVISYNVSMLVFVFFVPLFIILGTNIKLLIKVRTKVKFNSDSRKI
jgi:hypothetical protein